MQGDPVTKAHKKSLDTFSRVTYLPYAIERMEDVMAMKPIEFTAEQLWDLFDYDPEVGKLIWKSPQSNAVKPGAEAGLVLSNGRRQLSIGHKQLYVHQLIWIMMTGVQAKGYVRHRNNNYDDNRWENLFEATPSATNFSRSHSKNNKSGFRGVSWNKPKKKWQAKIKLNGRDTHLGYFETLELAYEARQAAEARIPKDISAEDFAFLGDAVKASRWQRTLWDRLLAEHDGKVGWNSFDEFATEIGTPASPNHRIVRPDESRQIGHDNWAILPPLSNEYDLTNVASRNSYNRARYKRNPNLDRNSGLKSRYGVDLAWVQKQLIAQGGVCAICGNPETQVTKGGKLKSLVVDHDHVTDEPRGLLCHAHNSGLGYFQDSINLLEAAIAYLRRHAEKEEAA